MTKSEEDQFDVIVIGSGISGLGAAISLVKMGKSVLVLEAKDYVGGRIKTIDVGGIKCDIGAMWIVGMIDNPIAKVAEDFGIKVVIDEEVENIAFDETTKERFNFDLMDEYFDQFVDEEYLEQLRIKLGENASGKDGADRFMTDKCIDSVDGLHKRIASFAIEDASMGMDYGTKSKNISLRYFYEGLDYDGDNCQFPNGFCQIIEGLAKDLDIRLSTPVQDINYSSDGQVIVTTTSTANNQTTATSAFRASQVIVTASIGVLKSKIINFNPPLPKEKQNAIDRLDIAISNKIILMFDKSFWHDCGDGKMVFIAKNSDESMYYYDFTQVYYGTPTLVGWFTGDSPTHKYMTDEELMKLCMKQLALTFSASIEIPLQPTSYYVSRWQDDPYTRGSYSYIPVGSSLEDMDVLGESVEDKVFFAGEGTNGMYFGTTHGAFLSGLRVAREIEDIVEDDEYSSAFVRNTALV